MKTQTKESVADYLNRGGTVTRLEASRDEIQVGRDDFNTCGFLVPRDNLNIPMQDMSKNSILGDFNYHGGMF